MKNQRKDGEEEKQNQVRKIAPKRERRERVERRVEKKG